MRSLPIVFLTLGLLWPALGLAQQDAPAGGSQPSGTTSAVEPGTAGIDTAALSASKRRKLTDLNTTVDLQGINNDGQTLAITYTIPYSGVVEFYLYTQDDELVWRNYYINTDGENEIKLIAKKIPPGNYRYELYYKGKTAGANFDIEG
jgi:hypothetical protein